MPTFEGTFGVAWFEERVGGTGRWRLRDTKIVGQHGQPDFRLENSLEMYIFKPLLSRDMPQDSIDDIVH